MSVRRTVYAAAIVGLCFAGSHLMAQGVKYSYKVAEGYFFREDPHQALPIYRRIASSKPNYKDVKYKIELCILLAGDTKRPLDAIIAFRDSDGKSDKFYYYWLGKILDYRYRFEEAILAWQQFLEIDVYKSPEIIKETEFFIQNTRNKIEIARGESRFQVVKLSDVINSDKPELTPTYIPKTNQLLFASAKESSDETILSIYGIERLENRWGTLTQHSPLGEFYDNTVNLMLVDEDGKLFMYYNHRGGDLYYSETTDESWTVPVEFDSRITTTHLGSHFYINEHEDRIVFSTDKHFKKNGLDIYESYKSVETGKWSKPAPFTSIINTELDEDSPFLTKDEKTLYFSSTGHNTIGGYDVFRSEFNETTNTWSEPVNIGYPINTADDEIQFKISDEGNEGFFSSNRLKPVHDYDIYMFYEPDWTKVEGKVYDMASNEALKNGEIAFSSTWLGEEKFVAETDSAGNYKIRVDAGRNYVIGISEGEEVIHQDEFEVIATETPTVHIKNFYLNMARSEGATSLAQEISSDDPNRYSSYEKPSTELSNLSSKYRTASKAILNNIYFDFGTSQLRPESNEVLRELFNVLSTNPQLRVEIAGHTDSVGPKDVNQWLSENRAKSVKKVMVNLGIPDNRMVATGYGESKPFATNDNEEEGRELNRRIEVLVIQ